MVLDERKCGNMKNTIEHIQVKLRQSLGMPLNDEEYSRSGGDTHMQEESGDDRNFEVDHAESSDDEDVKEFE